jgi:hypothetical protein
LISKWCRWEPLNVWDEMATAVVIHTILLAIPNDIHCLPGEPYGFHITRRFCNHEKCTPGRELGFHKNPAQEKSTHFSEWEPQTKVNMLRWANYKNA